MCISVQLLGIDCIVYSFCHRVFTAGLQPRPAPIFFGKEKGHRNVCVDHSVNVLHSGFRTFRPTGSFPEVQFLVFAGLFHWQQNTQLMCACREDPAGGRHKTKHDNSVDIARDSTGGKITRVIEWLRGVISILTKSP